MSCGYYLQPKVSDKPTKAGVLSYFQLYILIMIMKLKIFYAFFYVSVGLAYMSYFNSKSHLFSSMVSPSFSPYPATMRPWNKEALKSMRQELGRVHMAEAGMIKKLEKSVIPNRIIKDFLVMSSCRWWNPLILPLDR